MILLANHQQQLSGNNNKTVAKTDMLPRSWAFGIKQIVRHVS